MAAENRCILYWPNGDRFCRLLLGIAFYYGLNNSTNEASGFLVGLHAALFLFTVNILLGICFAFNRFVLHAGILKWIVNLLILISAAAYFFPAASNWFGYISSKEFLFFLGLIFVGLPQRESP